MSVVQWTTGIQHIGIPTSDIETTIRFYEGLGFQTMHTNQVPANQAKVAFLQLGNLMIETYAEGGNGLDGAINHFALNCTDIQAAYAWICEQGYKVLSNGIEELPFWEKGVAFFIIEGPNKERRCGSAPDRPMCRRRHRRAQARARRSTSCPCGSRPPRSSVRPRDPSTSHHPKPPQRRLSPSWWFYPCDGYSEPLVLGMPCTRGSSSQARRIVRPTALKAASIM